MIFKAVEGANADCKSQIALEFFLLAKYQIAFSVHGLKYADVSGDGFKELVALSVRGIHLFQVSYSYVDLFACVHFEPWQYRIYLLTASGYLLTLDQRTCYTVEKHWTN